MTELRGIRAQIVVGPYGTCANGGISERVREVTIVARRVLRAVGSQDTPLGELPSVRRLAEELLTATDEAPAAVLVARHLGQGVHCHVEPFEPCPAGRIGYMAVSGSILWVLIDEWTLKLHDRSETPEQYAALSV